MSWSKQQSLKWDGQGKVRIKIKDHDALGATELSAVSDAIEAAREILPYALAQLAWPQDKAGRNARMHRYFKTGPTPSTADIQTVYSKLELTMNGLNSKFNLKVADDRGAYGYVGFRTGAKGVLRGIFSRRHNFGTRQGKIVTRGDIHMNKLKLDDHDIAVITLIHEATHKFASTADHGDQGYIHNDGLTFWEDGISSQKALNNADSYAWFCLSEYNGAP